MNNQYTVTVLIEDTVCSKIWKEEIEGLKEKLSSEFNQIAIYTFTKDENFALVVKDNENNPVDLVKDSPSENNLVFVASDACSTIWHNNEVYNLLNNLQKTSLVSIVNTLPPILWRGLAVDTMSEIKTSLPLGVKKNAEIISELPSYFSQEDLENLLIMPMVELGNIDQLVSTIINGGTVANTSLYKNSLALTTNNKITTPQEQVDSFITRTFKPAYDLAVYFSNVPSFTISDIDFVRQHMLPETNKSSIAEFLLGGIVDKALPLEDRLEFTQTTVIGEGTQNSYSLTMSYSGPRTTEAETRYKIKENVGEILVKSLRYSHEHAVKLLLEEKKYQDFDKEYSKVQKPKM